MCSWSDVSILYRKLQNDAQCCLRYYSQSAALHYRRFATIAICFTNHIIKVK